MKEEDQPLDYPLDGILDLHMFRPQETKAAVLAYIEACREAGILDLRIIHGKGQGTLREQVRALLQRHEAVDTFSTAPAEAGGWGATIVRLKRNPAKPTS